MNMCNCSDASDMNLDTVFVRNVDNLLDHFLVFV
jgi:hypothetical protein